MHCKHLIQNCEHLKEKCMLIGICSSDISVEFGVNIIFKLYIDQ